MLKRGWMNRYLPERAAPVADVATAFGYAWAGLMFASAALNIALALSLDAKTWAAVMSALGHREQDRPVPDPVRRDERRREAPCRGSRDDGTGDDLIHMDRAHPCALMIQRIHMRDERAGSARSNDYLNSTVTTS